MKAIDETQAEQILVTHGHTGPMVRWLRENGKQARAVVTKFNADGSGVIADDEVVEDMGSTEPVPAE